MATSEFADVADLRSRCTMCIDASSYEAEGGNLDWLRHAVELTVVQYSFTFLERLLPRTPHLEALVLCDALEEEPVNTTTQQGQQQHHHVDPLAPRLASLRSLTIVGNPLTSEADHRRLTALLRTACEGLEELNIEGTLLASGVSELLVLGENATTTGVSRRLRSLVLRGVPLPSAKDVAAFVRQCESGMEVLDFSHSVMTSEEGVMTSEEGVMTSEEGVQLLLEAIPHSTAATLRQLELGGLYVGPRAGAALRTLIKATPKLTHLSIANHVMPDSDCAALVQDLAPLRSTLQQLDISGLLVGPLTLQAVANLLKPAAAGIASTMQHLCVGTRVSAAELFQRRGPTSAPAVGIVERLAARLRLCSSLCELDLSGHDLRVSAKLIVDAIKDSKCPLKQLRLSHCRMGDAAIINLMLHLQGLGVTSLKELDLTANDLTELSVKSITGCVKMQLALHSLSLGGNILLPVDQIVLSSLGQLRRLDVSSTSLTASSFEQLVKHLLTDDGSNGSSRRPQTLEALGVGYLSVVTEELLLPVVKAFPNLTALSIADRASTETMGDVLKGWNRLTYLDVSHTAQLTTLPSTAHLRTLLAQGSSGVSNAALKGATRLIRLNVSGNSTVDSVAPFAKTLRELAARDSAINDQGLRDCTRLVVLDVAGNQNVTTVKPFAAELRILDASAACGITNDGLQDAVHVVSLNVNDNPSLSFVPRLVVELNASGNQCAVSDQSLAESTEITKLSVQYNPNVTTVKPFGAKLQVLNASGENCRIDDKGLQEARRIMELHVSNNPGVQTLAPFAETLRILTISGEECGIGNGALSLATKLFSLSVENNQDVTNVTKCAETLWELNASGQNCALDEAALTGAKNLFSVISSGNSKIVARGSNEA